MRYPGRTQPVSPTSWLCGASITLPSAANKMLARYGEAGVPPHRMSVA
jgi:hypothetical protein